MWTSSRMFYLGGVQDQRKNMKKTVMKAMKKKAEKEEDKRRKEEEDEDEEEGEEEEKAVPPSVSARKDANVAKREMSKHQRVIARLEQKNEELAKRMKENKA